MKQHFHGNAETNAGEISSHSTICSGCATKIPMDGAIQREFWCLLA
jgi:hypothetical protein